MPNAASRSKPSNRLSQYLGALIVIIYAIIADALVGVTAVVCELPLVLMLVVLIALALTILVVVLAAMVDLQFRLEPVNDHG